jgi:hypothetical protein
MRHFETGSELRSAGSFGLIRPSGQASTKPGQLQRLHYERAGC